jgi:hypothetical protein
MKAALVVIAVTLAHLTAQVRPLGPPPPPPEQTGKASIEGSVVDALTHEPVKKASVMLNGRINLTAVTDASGQFAFRQLPAGQYSVQAQSNRYPIGRIGGNLARQTSVTVAGDEQKRDVTLSLTPGASVRGRILDEEGNPMPRCIVSSMQMATTDNGKSLVNAGGGTPSDDNGEYRVSNLPAGKYYLMASCPQSIPMPHAFIRRGVAANLPMLVYASLFYPGTADPSGAARVEAQPGGLLAGIDFRMMPATGVTVRGRVRPASFDGFLQVSIEPNDPLRRGFGGRGTRTNPSTGEFQIPNVQPGSYELIAGGTAGNQQYFAKIPVEVGASTPDPIELLLAPASRIPGTLVIEGDAKQPPNPNPIRVMLNPASPASNQPMFGPPPQAEVRSDGVFVFESVIPGRWRVQLNGPGYLKSMALGDHEISGDEIEITAAAAPLKIVVGTKYAQLAVSASPPPAGAGSLTGLAWATTSSIQQYFGLDSQGMGNLSVPPGRYHVCGLVEAQPWMLMQNRALRKAVEDRCATVDVLEGGPQKVQISLISSEELKRIVDSLDE